MKGPAWHDTHEVRRWRFKSAKAFDVALIIARLDAAGALADTNATVLAISDAFTLTPNERAYFFEYATSARAASDG